MFNNRYDEVLEWGASLTDNGLADGVSRQVVLRNRYVFHTGDHAYGLYLVLEGLVKVSKVTRDGGEKVLHIATKGDFLGEVPVFLEQSYDTTAQAVSDVVLLFIPLATFFALLRDSPTVFRRMLGVMARKVHCLLEDIESNFKAGHQRVADFLLSHASSAPSHEDGAFSVVLPIKKIDLASLLSLTPQHFSRILQDMRLKGLIAVDGNVIHVPSVENLRSGWLRFGKNESILQAVY